MVADILNAAALLAIPGLVVNRDGLTYSAQSGLWTPASGDVRPQGLYFSILSESTDAAQQLMQSNLACFLGYQTRDDRADVDSIIRLALAQLRLILSQIPQAVTTASITGRIDYTEVRLRFSEQYAGYSARFTIVWSLTYLNDCCNESNA